METQVLSIDPCHPEPEIIQRGADVLRRGGLVAFPTETVYGLGANALDAEAAQGIFNAKGRPARNPLIVHLPRAEAVEQVATVWPVHAQKLADAFWPGPLTLVLPKKKCVPLTVTGGGSTVAVRVPKHPVAQAILNAVDFPVAAPSANRSSRLSPTLAEHVFRDLEGRIQLILDGGPTPGGLESTVVDLTDHPKLLRPGLISIAQVEQVLGFALNRSETNHTGNEPLRSPGQLTKHYSPKTPLQLCEENDGGKTLVDCLSKAGQRIGWVPFGNGDAFAPNSSVIVMPLPRDPKVYSSRLYATLHALDFLNTDRIIVALPPDTPEWLAVRDRLQRAAASI